MKFNMNIGEFELDNIYLADSYEAIKEIPDKSIDLIVTDPPYEINSTTGGGMLEEKHLRKMFDELVDNELQIGIDDTILDEFMRIMKVPNIYIWCNKVMIPKLIDYFVIKGEMLFDIISWHKSNIAPLCGSKYLTDTEYCLYFRKGVRLNTTYETARTYYEQPMNVKDKDRFEHPTIKPLNIITNLIINSSNEGDVVFDPFCGSGTTCVAAKNLGRRYLGFEISDKWHKIATNRLNNISADGQMSLFTM